MPHFPQWFLHSFLRNFRSRAWPSNFADPLLCCYLQKRKWVWFRLVTVVMVGFVDDTVNDGNNCCRNAGKENVFVSHREWEGCINRVADETL